MAGSKSDYLEKALLDLILGNTAWAPPPTVFIALSTANYNDGATGSAMTEVLGTIGGQNSGYSRVAVTNNATNFPPASGTTPSTKNNGTAITYAAATQAWGEIRSFYITDSVTGGNVLYGGDLTLAKTIQQGDTATFAASSITITED